jgi:hypothetical protein
MKTLIKMQFDPKIAKKVGTDEAIILSNIEFWQTKHMIDYQQDLLRMDKPDAQKKNNIVNGRVWTYNSRKSWTNFFPYLSERQIGRALNKLKEHGFLLIEQHNKKNYDRTNWYSSTQLPLILDEPNEPVHEPMSVHLETEPCPPIPDNKPDNKHSLQSDDCEGELPLTGPSARRDEFNSADYVRAMTTNKRPHIALIGKYFQYTGKTFPSRKAAEAEIRRWVKDSTIIVEYPEKSLNAALTYVSREFPAMWNLSTIRKYINNNIIWK